MPYSKETDVNGGTGLLEIEMRFGKSEGKGEMRVEGNEKL